MTPEMQAALGRQQEMMGASMAYSAASNEATMVFQTEMSALNAERGAVQAATSMMKKAGDAIAQA